MPRQTRFFKHFKTAMRTRASGRVFVPIPPGLPWIRACQGRHRGETESHAQICPVPQCSREAPASLLPGWKCAPTPENCPLLSRSPQIARKGIPCNWRPHEVTCKNETLALSLPLSANFAHFSGPVCKLCHITQRPHPGGSHHGQGAAGGSSGISHGYGRCG